MHVSALLGLCLVPATSAVEALVEVYLEQLFEFPQFALLLELMLQLVHQSDEVLIYVLLALALGEHLRALGLELIDFDQGWLLALQVAEQFVDGANGPALPLELLEQLEEVASHEERLNRADHVALGVLVRDSSVN